MSLPQRLELPTTIPYKRKDAETWYFGAVQKYLILLFVSKVGRYAAA
jgi:hypothetical protein